MSSFHSSGRSAMKFSTTTTETPRDPDSPLNGEFATTGGSSIDLGDLQGKDVVLWFWAPW